MDTKVWMLQTTGSVCSISLLDLFDVGLYVANHKYTFEIPSTVMEFVSNINLILRIFLTLQREANKLANSVVGKMPYAALQKDCLSTFPTLNKMFTSSRFLVE